MENKNNDEDFEPGDYKCTGCDGFIVIRKLENKIVLGHSDPECNNFLDAKKKFAIKDSPINVAVSYDEIDPFLNKFRN